MALQTVHVGGGKVTATAPDWPKEEEGGVVLEEKGEGG